MQIVQGIDQQDKSTQKVTSDHGQLRHIADNHCCEGAANCVVVTGTSGVLTQVLESEFSDTLGALVAGNVTHLGNLDNLVLSRRVIGQRVPAVLNFFRCFFVHRTVIVILTLLVEQTVVHCRNATRLNKTAKELTF